MFWCKWLVGYVWGYQLFTVCALAPGYVSRFGVSLSVGPAEEVESGDQLQAGLGPASVIHEPSRRRAGEGLRRDWTVGWRGLWGPLLHPRTLLSTEVATLTTLCAARRYTEAFHLAQASQLRQQMVYAKIWKVPGGPIPKEG